MKNKSIHRRTILKPALVFKNSISQPIKLVFKLYNIYQNMKKKLRDTPKDIKFSQCAGLIIQRVEKPQQNVIY